jgi:hypothetical protein
MKTKILLIFMVITAALIAFGCSNRGPISAPADNTESLKIPNGIDYNRFEQESVMLDSKGPEPAYEILAGTYEEDHLGCTSLHINKDIYVELHFVTSQPSNLTNGTVLEVRGNYNSVPGGRCQLSRVFNVYEIIFVGNKTHKKDLDNNIG